MYGVGFLVSSKWKYNIEEFRSYSERVATLKFSITKNKYLKIIQVHAPTSSHSDAEIEEFYDLVTKAYYDQHCTWTLIIGDFNAKIGKSADSNTNIVGPYGLGTRNERGTKLIDFAFNLNLSISNSFFFKKSSRRWTWRSPDKITRNEIDFCLSSCRKIVSNIEILNAIKFTSDHRPLRISLALKQKIARMKMIRKSMQSHDRITLHANKHQFKLELKNSFSMLKDLSSENGQTQYDNIRESIYKASQTIRSIKKKEQKLSPTTKKLIEERQKLMYHTPEHREKDKAVKRSIRKDIRQFNINQVETALTNNTSLKIAKQGLQKGKCSIVCLKDINGVKQGSRQKILEICTNFYTNLYSDSSFPPNVTEEYSPSEEIMPITTHEVHIALNSMKYNKAPGHDEITTNALKIGEPILIPHLTNLFNTILQTGKFPNSFCHSNVILLHKKGDKSNIENYRPISLVSHIYKTFIKVIENRISSTLDIHQPPEQAGFRKGLSTADHLHSINQIIEKYTEFDMPLYLAFVDYSKAFDSISHSAIFKSLKNQDIPESYIHLLQNIYKNSTAAIKLDTTGPSFPIEKGVKQGDPLSPKLFTATLEEVFQKLLPGWEEKGILIGDKKLTNLRFADDIVLFSSSASELGHMLQDLSKVSRDVGLKMNMSKTNLMTNNTKRKILVDNVEIAYVNEYVYLGQLVSFQARQEREVKRRIENAWKSYWSMKDLMKGNMSLSLKRRLMDVCILPILTYGAQTWSLTESLRSDLAVCQRAMERSILGVKLTDRIRNTILRSKTRIADVTQKASNLKWNWAGHVYRMSDDRWAKITTQWQPNGKRRCGRPKRRWRDDLDKHLKDWTTLTQDRQKWKEGREAFAQHWDTMGS